MCKTNATFIEWNVTVSQYQRSTRYILSRFGISQHIAWILIDESNVFNISKVFDENLTLPLISVMFSDNVTASINESLIIVHCTEYYNLNSNLDIWIMNTLTTRLHIIEPEAPNYCRFYMYQEYIIKRERGEYLTCSTSLRKVMILTYWTLQRCFCPNTHGSPTREQHLPFWGTQTQPMLYSALFSTFKALT